ncbi:AAA family ATPase [Sphaerisporangium dianthi]|uniref:AAA family ATPase n=1 Tax=Sphaerisporangium dianthi TaxID=1436120 RepID=A0ABV9CS66_9ACTN
MSKKCKRCGADLVSLPHQIDGWGEYYACAGCEHKPEGCTCEPKEAPAQPFARRIKLTRASEIEPEPVEWMWEDNGRGRIPSGALAVAAGREGTGKSSFGIWMAAGVTTGTLPGPLLGRPHDVIYVAVEDSWKHTLVPRLIAAGANLDRVWRAEVEISEDETSTINLPNDFALLEDSIAHNGVKLVILDPLISTISAGIDTHKERSVRMVLDPLARLGDRTGCVMLGIAHFGKGAGTDASSLITGSGAFKNVPRAVLAFAVDPDEGTRVMTQSKNSLGLADLPSLAYNIESVKIETKKGTADVGKFVFCGEAPRSVGEILASNGDDSEQRNDKAGAVEFLIEALAGGWRKTTEIQEEAKQIHGISERTLNRARKSLAVVAKNFPTGPNGKGEWWLALPEQSATLPDPEGKGAKP